MAKISEHLCQEVDQFNQAGGMGESSLSQTRSGKLTH